MDSNVFPYISITIWQIKKINDIYFVNQIDEICAEDPENTATASGRKMKEYLNKINNKETVFIYGDPSTKARNTIDDDKKTFYDKFTDEIKKGHKISRQVVIVKSKHILIEQTHCMHRNVFSFTDAILNFYPVSSPRHTINFYRKLVLGFL